MVPISRMKTPTQVIPGRKRQERHAAIPVSCNNSGVESNQRPRNPKMPHEGHGITRHRGTGGLGLADLLLDAQSPVGGMQAPDQAHGLAALENEFNQVDYSRLEDSAVRGIGRVV